MPFKTCIDQPFHMKMKLIMLSVMLLLGNMQADACVQTDLQRKGIYGIQTGYGFQNGLHVNYHYEVLFVLLKYHVPLLEKNAWSFEIVPQPQINFSQYKVTNNSPKKERGFELGINIGMAVRKSFPGDQLGVYLMAGVGPHYVSGVPERQSKGFIFSDHITLGMVFQLSERLALDVSAGFRHISNASLKRPNGGVNNLLVLGGIVYGIRN